jgi:uncharacterized protein
VATLAGNALGENALAVTVDSPLIPEGDLAHAKLIAADIGIEHLIIKLNELNIPGFCNNPRNRCYLCKKFRYEQMQVQSTKYEINAIADGTTTSDLGEYRPGLKASEELGVYSPLLEAGVSKAEVYKISEILGLSTASRAPNSCLATRIPYDHSLDIEKLKRIDRAEKLVYSLSGVRVLRVRDHENLARIEISQDNLNLFRDHVLLEKITQGLKSLGFLFVTIDLEGYRSGCFD